MTGDADYLRPPPPLPAWTGPWGVDLPFGDARLWLMLHAAFNDRLLASRLLVGPATPADGDPLPEDPAALQGVPVAALVRRLQFRILSLVAAAPWYATDDWTGDAATIEARYRLTTGVAAGRDRQDPAYGFRTRAIREHNPPPAWGNGIFAGDQLRVERFNADHPPAEGALSFDLVAMRVMRRAGGEWQELPPGDASPPDQVEYVFGDDLVDAGGGAFNLRRGDVLDAATVADLRAAIRSMRYLRGDAFVTFVEAAAGFDASFNGEPTQSVESSWNVWHDGEITSPLRGGPLAGTDPEDGNAVQPEQAARGAQSYADSSRSAYAARFKLADAEAGYFESLNPGDPGYDDDYSWTNYLGQTFSGPQYVQRREPRRVPPAAASRLYAWAEPFVYAAEFHPMASSFEYAAAGGPQVLLLASAAGGPVSATTGSSAIPPLLPKQQTPGYAAARHGYSSVASAVIYDFGGTFRYGP